MAERILIVEDDEELAELLGLLFTKKGYETATALNGRDALRLLDEFKPAVVIQDYMLPDIGGVELLKEFRIGRPDAYVVIITARGSEDVAVQMMKAGAADYIRKPFDTEKLLLTIENMLKLRSSETERYKLLCEIQRQNRELLAINALSAALTSPMSRSMKCSSAIDIIMNVMHADITNVFITNPGGGLSLMNSHLEGGGGLVASDFPKAKSLASYIVEIQKPAVIADISQETRIKIPQKILELGMTSALGVPMIQRDEVRGVLEVYTKDQRTFPSFDIKLMASFANLLAMALDNETMHESLDMAETRWQATSDTIPDLITVQDKEHRIIRANRAAAEIAGVPIEGLIGQQCCWMFHSIKHPIKDCPVEEVFRTKKPASSIITAPGSSHAYNVEATPVFDESGDIIMVVERASKIEG
jgi:PAS domain S-box-containing protein